MHEFVIIENYQYIFFLRISLFEYFSIKVESDVSHKNQIRQSHSSFLIIALFIVLILTSEPLITVSFIIPTWRTKAKESVRSAIDLYNGQNVTAHPS